MNKLTISWKNKLGEKPVAVFTGSIDALHRVMWALRAKPTGRNYNYHIEYGKEVVNG